MCRSKNVYFLKMMLMLVLLTAYSGCSGCGPGAPTTLQRTIVPDDIPASSATIAPYEISKYAQNGYGKWHYGPGVDSVKRLDLMSTTYSGAFANDKRLLNFFAMSDVHIADKESPSQAIAMWDQGFSTSAYSGTMLYTTQLLNAAVQTINALHSDNPFDFGISLGDSSNSTQYNEARWYIDVLDGKAITPSSGAHAGADTIDYQKPFQATGLDKTIPWYQAVGNHDHFWMGFWPVDDYFIQHSGFVGEDIVGLGVPFLAENYYMGAIDGSTPYGDVIGAGKVADFSVAPKVPAADPDRRALSKKEWMAEFLTTSSTPVGHGFTQTNIDDDFACYSFVPKADVPIKIIVLDDTQDPTDPMDPTDPENNFGVGSVGYAHGKLDTARYNWLVKELDEGQAAGQLMIVTAHIPIGVEVPPSSLGWNPTLESTLIAKLHTYSNFVLWIAGHRHYNTVTAFKSPDEAHPELGFWQVETASLKDFPQQFRTFEIFRNNDNNLSIVTTDVDTNFEEGSLAAISRTYGVAAQQIYKPGIGLLPSGSYNAELVKQLSPEMQEILRRL